MSRFAPLGAALLTALAAWLSQGTIGFASPDGGRLAILPVSLTSGLITAAATVAMMVLWSAGASRLPAALLTVLLLPWLPFPVPPAFLLWVEGLCWAVWIATAVLTVGSLPLPRLQARANPRLIAAAAALAIFGASAVRVDPMLPGGDEPHYLIVAQSLLLDRSLTIESVHRRGDYRSYYPGDLPPHVQRRGRDGRIYSVHAPGLPAVVAPAFALGGYPAVVVFLVILAAAGSALAWHVAWLATGRTDAAWFGWAAVTLPITAIFQSFTIYPDGLGGVLALTGLWALLRADDEARSGATHARPWLLHGIALAMLPWLHSRFAVLAGGFGALILLRLSTTKNPAAKAVAFLSVPAVSAILWVGFFIAIYGTPDPSAPYVGEIGSFVHVPGGLGGLLFDQRFGLLAYAPVLAVAIAGLSMMVAVRARRRLALELLFVIVPYLLTVTHFPMWWGGWSAPARFFAAVLPLFAVPAAVAWTRIDRQATRFMAAAAVAATALASLVVVWTDGGRLAYNTREARALWLEWLNRLADLTSAAPLWARDANVPLFRAIAIWGGALMAAWALLRALERTGRLPNTTAIRTAGAAAIVAAMMTASSLVWAFEGASGRSTIPSQLGLLESLAAEPRIVAMKLDGWTRLDPASLAGLVSIEVTRTPTVRAAGRETPPMFILPSLPAGEYRVRVTDGTRGLLMIGIARDQFSLQTLQLPGGPIAFRFTLPVRNLIVRGDEDARRVITAMTLEPIRILKPAERTSEIVARRAVRYGSATAFFLDERSFPEPEGFWVGGQRDTEVVVQPDAPRRAVSLLLRNGAVENQVSVQAGTWRQDLQLTPGQEQRLDVPLDHSRGAVAIHIASRSGFRPSDADPASSDQRYLGVWVQPVP